MSELIDSTEHTPAQAPGAGLYLVSTPIGNLRDITLRALDIFGSADAVVCEDSRVTGFLMQRYGFKKKLIVYNDHSDDADREAILSRLKSGETLALVSDAGTPLLSDPGYKLVHAAMHEGIEVFPIPGASALLPALQISGLPCDRFSFFGFLPHKSGQRCTLFEKLKTVPVTMVFYESPNRIADTIKDAYATLGDRPMAMVREITKLHEETHRGTLAAFAADENLLGTLKGEMVLLIGGSPEAAVTEDELKRYLAQALETMSVKDAAAHVAASTGASKKIVYDLALQIRAHGGFGKQNRPDDDRKS